MLLFGVVCFCNVLIAVACCLLFDVCWSLCVVCCLVCCVWLDADCCCLLCVVSGLLWFVACLLLFIAGWCYLCVACSLLFVDVLSGVFVVRCLMIIV